MTGIVDLLLFDDDDYADADDTFGEDLDLFLDTCIIFASLPSHSATSLSAVLLCVHCVCFPAGFWSFNVLVGFSSLGFCNFLENQGRDIAGGLTVLTF